MQPVGIFHARARCPRCSATNTIDLRRTGLRRRARCGRCGEPLRRRLPSTLWMAAGTVVVLLLGVAWLVAGRWAHGRHEGRVEHVTELVDSGRAADAVRLLDRARRPSSADGELARRVALALAEPVLAVDTDEAAGPAAVSGAIAIGDALLEEHAAQGAAGEGAPHGAASGLLPELVPVLDPALGRLKEREAAHRILARALALASTDDPDLRKVDDALADARLEAADAPGSVSLIVRDLEPGVRARAVLTRARTLLARRPAESRKALEDGASALDLAVRGRLDAATRDARLVRAEPPEDLARASAGEQAGRLRAAIASDRRDELRALVMLRPDPAWPAAEQALLDEELRRACVALAALESARARATSDSAERVDALIAALTCDQVLPDAFLVAARPALASALFDAARGGGARASSDLAGAVTAWAGLRGDERDRGLAAAACLAEARADHVLALHAWSLVASRDVLATLGDCAAAASAAPVVAAPALDAATLPAPGPSRGASARPEGESRG